MRTPVLYATALILLSPALLAAVELESVRGDEARKWGARLAELAVAIENPQVAIEPDADKANGVHVPDKIGMIIVPQKDLKESEELAAKFREESGAALAYLFAYHVVPIVDGPKVDRSRLRTIQVRDDGDQEHTVYVHLLAVRQLPGDDYRLYVYGTDKRPIVDAKFSEGTGPGPEPVAIQIKNVDAQTGRGTVVVTVFGKYQASFQAGFQDE